MCHAGDHASKHGIRLANRAKNHHEADYGAQGNVSGTISLRHHPCAEPRAHARASRPNAGRTEPQAFLSGLNYPHGGVHPRRQQKSVGHTAFESFITLRFRLRTK